MLFGEREQPWSDVSLCKRKKKEKQRHEKRVTVCKSTFHHFYNAYIRLWVLGFYASLFFCCALRVLAHVFFLWQAYRGKCFYFVFVADKIVPYERFLSHLTHWSCTALVCKYNNIRAVVFVRILSKISNTICLWFIHKEEKCTKRNPTDENSCECEYKPGRYGGARVFWCCRFCIGRLLFNLIQTRLA